MTDRPKSLHIQDQEGVLTEFSPQHYEGANRAERWTACVEDLIQVLAYRAGLRVMNLPVNFRFSEEDTR